MRTTTCPLAPTAVEPTAVSATTRCAKPAGTEPTPPPSAIFAPLTFSVRVDRLVDDFPLPGSPLSEVQAYCDGTSALFHRLGLRTVFPKTQPMVTSRQAGPYKLFSKRLALSYAVTCAEFASSLEVFARFDASEGSIWHLRYYCARVAQHIQHVIDFPVIQPFCPVQQAHTVSFVPLPLPNNTLGTCSKATARSLSKGHTDITAAFTASARLFELRLRGHINATFVPGSDNAAADALIALSPSSA